MKMLTKIWNMETGWMNKWPGIPEKSKTQMSGGGGEWEQSEVQEWQLEVNNMQDNSQCRISERIKVQVLSATEYRGSSEATQMCSTSQLSYMTPPLWPQQTE